MYKLCKTEQSALRQQQLEAGLLRAMVAKPYDEISISDLCDQLEIPRKSFYRYFSGKDGALHALIDHTLMRFDGYTHEYQRSHERTVLLDLESFFAFWLEYRELLDALMKNSLSGVLIERAIAYALTEEVMPARFLPSDTKAMQREITTFGVCGLMSMVLSWYHRGFDQHPRELARVAARLLGQPLFPNADKLL